MRYSTSILAILFLALVLKASDSTKNEPDLIDFDALKTVHDTIIIHNTTVLDANILDCTDSISDQEYASSLIDEAYNFYWGYGVKCDYFKAFELFNEALDYDNNNTDAKFGLAQCYYYGNGTTKDYKKAFELYKFVSDCGNLDAMFMTAGCYEKGHGVKENLRRALELYRLAAAHGHINSQKYLRKMGY